MKKFLSLMLLACMLLSATALADFSKIVQDELPPELVAVRDEATNEIILTVYNAEGEVIATVNHEGDIILTDVHFRAEAVLEDIVIRLTSAYEGVMEDVHHSDVTCELHEHNVKVDINQVLGAIDHEDLDAHDLIMYELYDVKFSEDVEALLVDGAYIPLTFRVAEGQPLPLIVLESGDGENWTVVPFAVVGEREFTVNMPSSATLALLCDGVQVMGIGQEKEWKYVVPGDTITDTEGGNFTPSVSGKPSPEVVTTVTEDGEVHVGTIYSDDGTQAIPVPDRNYILVTAPIEKEYNIDIQTYEHLEWAYKTILNAEHVCQLPSDSHEGTIAEDLTARLEEMQLDLTCEELVVKDLFEVSAYGDYLHYLYNEDCYLEVTFKTDLDPSKAVIVIHSYDSVNWHLHSIEESLVHEDGSITMKLYDLGTVAILVEADDAVVSLQDAVLSPN